MVLQQQCNYLLGSDDYTEEHPEYNNVVNAFEALFKLQLSDSLPDDFFDDDDLSSDYLVAVDQIITELYGTEEAKNNVIKNPDDYIPPHPYTLQIARAKAVALDVLKSAALTAKALSPVFSTDGMTVSTSKMQATEFSCVEDDSTWAAVNVDAETQVDDAKAEGEFVTTFAINDNPVPPRFRRVSGWKAFHLNGKDYSPEDTIALKQRQLDDLVYLRNQSRFYSGHKKYEGLFTPDGKLNMPLAITFVEEKAWNLEKKARQLLKLTEFEQLQCDALASKKINDKWLNSIKQAAKIEEKLNDLAENDNRLRHHVEGFTKLAQAAYLCNGWPADKLPIVFGWLTGKKPISRQAISAKIKRLEKRLA